MILSKKIGIDLGTSTVLIYVKGEGIVVNEPSLVAVNRDGTRILAVGREALEMVGRAPDTIQVVRPMREGVIADFVVTEGMLHHFIGKVQGRQRIFKPEIMICVPSGVTSVERRAVTEAAISAGARQAWLIDEPLAAAIGAGLPISEPRGNAICDVGGGTTVTQDVLPFSVTSASRDTHAYNLNKVGLERRGFSNERIHKIRHAYKVLLASKLNTTQALEALQADAERGEDVDLLIRFIQSSTRGVIK